MTENKQPPTDPARMYLAIVKLCKVLGVRQEPDVADHVLLEQLAERARFAITAAAERGYRAGRGA